jgi:hypothetical protein
VMGLAVACMASCCSVWWLTVPSCWVEDAHQPELPVRSDICTTLLGVEASCTLHVLAIDAASLAQNLLEPPVQFLQAWCICACCLHAMMVAVNEGLLLVVMQQWHAFQSAAAQQQPQILARHCCNCMHGL